MKNMHTPNILGINNIDGEQLQQERLEISGQMGSEQTMNKVDGGEQTMEEKN